MAFLPKVHFYLFYYPVKGRRGRGEEGAAMMKGERDGGMRMQ